eukprot:JP446164.1.p2 GENE.JP446164.1~~JP446164.1.p2  ORF type:complete len:468 (+),score=124.44 JP446164.1:42-1445(+)
MLLRLCALFVVVAAVPFLHNMDHKIVDLPGMPDGVNFDQYAGYLTVDENHGRELFYWFVESQQDPANDPLVIWFNGGPGCSSMGGFLSELGPFYPNTDGKTLRHNEWSWNKVANIIFLDSPAGVGFSKTNTTEDYTVGDERTAHDAYTFLEQFFLKYPQYQNRALWISGESYAGHYVPNLAKLIVDMNAAGTHAHMNLQGFVLGNPWTDAHIDNVNAAFYWWSHNLVADDTYEGILKYCNFSHIGPIAKSAGKALLGSAPNEIDNEKCDQFCDRGFSEMGNINIYDIYVDVCLNDEARHFLGHLGSSDAPLRAFASAAQYDPCVDNEASNYLNLPEVQKAIHADIPYRWMQCSPFVKYSRNDLLTSMLPVYQALLKSGIHMLVFSGDVDAIVPTTGTRAWFSVLEQDAPIVNRWKRWEVQQQLAGYIVEYEHNLTFATVREAGHMVPFTQPERGFAMFSRYIKNKAL